MSPRSRAGGRPVKPGRRKTARLKRRNGPKAVRRRGSPTAGQETKVTRLTRELQSSEERWRSLLENPIFGVTFLDEHQRFISTNQAFRTMTGYSEKELRQMTLLDINIAGEREFGHQGAEGNLSLSIDIRDGVYEEIVAVYLHLEPFIPQLLEIGATTYQWV